MTRMRVWAFGLLVLSIFLSVAPPCLATLKETHSLLGTIVEITIVSADESKGQKGMEEAFAEIHRIEALMSYYRPESEVSRINNAPAEQKVEVGEELFRLLQHAQTISQLTGGAFDITFTPLWQLWGRCAKKGRLPSPEEIREAKGLVDFRQIKLSEGTHEVELGKAGMRVNLGGIAKGYALDRTGRVLKNAGLDNFLVNMGGDILAMGEGREGKGWRIGIRHPRRPQELTGMLRIGNGCVLTSGDYERYFEIEGKRYHHILDVRTGYPVDSCSQVTVVAPNLGSNYLPSIALFLLGPEAGLHHMENYPEMAALIITPEGKVVATSNFSTFLEAPLPPTVDMAPVD